MEEVYISQVEVCGKQPNPLDELMIVNLASSYTIIHTLQGHTMLDIHLKIQEAEALCEDLKAMLTNQVVSPSVDR